MERMHTRKPHCGYPSYRRRQRRSLSSVHHTLTRYAKIHSIMNTRPLRRRSSRRLRGMTIIQKCLRSLWETPCHCCILTGVRPHWRLRIAQTSSVKTRARPLSGLSYQHQGSHKTCLQGRRHAILSEMLTRVLDRRQVTSASVCNPNRRHHDQSESSALHLVLAYPLS